MIFSLPERVIIMRKVWSMGELDIHKNFGEILESLPEDKRLFVEKHSLLLTWRMMWITMRENSFPRKICRHQFFMKSDMVGLLFRLNEICFAKVNWFRQNIEMFEPYVYDFESGFRKTVMWDAEFFRHIPSGFIIDFRFLQKMKDIEEFRKFCTHLENRDSGLS